MKVVLGLIGGFLILDGGFTVLIALIWTLKQHTPDFMTFTPYGIWSLATMGIKLLGGFGGLLLVKAKPLGRSLGMLALANNAVFSVALVLMGAELTNTVFAAFAIYFLSLAMLALPAARDACEIAAPPRRRPGGRPTPTPTARMHRPTHPGQ